MTDTSHAKILVVASFDLPRPNLTRMIWQPVTNTDGLRMRRAPLDWQPSGAHHALEALAAERDRLAAQVVQLQRDLDAANARAERAEASLDRVTAERDAMVEALKPSGDTKAQYSGEFSISVYSGEDEDGTEQWRQVLVDWTTIKAIMAAIKARSAKAAAQADYEARILSALEKPHD